MFKVTSDTIDLNIKETKLPCDSCGAFCCSSTVLFHDDEITELTSLYPSKMKKIKKVHSKIPKAYTLKFKGRDIKSCVFLVDGKCSIYENRPLICKEYGVKRYVPCPFNHMDETLVSCLSNTDKLRMDNETSIEGSNFMLENIEEINVDTGEQFV